MVSDSARAWNWEDPQELSATVDTFTADLARCDKLELVASASTFTRHDLRDIGITGIEFAAFKTAHPEGLGSDLVGPHSPGATSERGGIYRVDGSSHFIELDISEPLPFESGSVDWVYAEHLIEHVSLTVGVAWLSEVRRILAPGGVIRVTTPDLRAYAQSYVNGDGFFAKHRRRMSMALRSVAPPMPARGAFMFNQLFYVYGHRWIYDEAELRYVLSEAGFAPDDVRLCAYRDGVRPDVAALDQVLRNDESIYVEATA
jgi:predicted SAM-dependent methyltransferase